MKTLPLVSGLLLLAGVVFAQTPAAPAPGKAPARPGLTLTTPAFPDGGEIPTKYTQAVPNPVSPKLVWSNVPANTVSFVLIMHDPDTAPQRKSADILHWMAFNLPGTASELPEGVPADARLADGTVQAKNFRGAVGYLGPRCSTRSTDTFWARACWWAGFTVEAGQRRSSIALRVRVAAGGTRSLRQRPAQRLPVGPGGLPAGGLHAGVAGENFLAEGGEGGAATGAAAPRDGDERAAEEGVHGGDELPRAIVGHVEFGGGGANRTGGRNVTQELGLARTERVGPRVGETQARLQFGRGGAASMGGADYLAGSGAADFTSSRIQ